MSKTEELHQSNCEKYGVFCEKCQYNEASYWERLKLKFHLLFCGGCRKYSKKNTHLSAAIRNAKFSNLTPEEQENFKQMLQSNFVKIRLNKK
ncbi:hypothetical protein ACFQ3R_06565 [Mesonia ostreae]|uniref:Glycine dehydrogenase n=1 Tax=Mesonia ostreae TaxID=861110 RepID=A0ABU2KH11_9FLAO|nr:hypothetical protein [Mesonia ostreae]MDT0293997.1 hypothetical protein [Mesonia ostreae]